MSIKLSNGTRVSIDLEDKETIAHIVKKSAEAQQQQKLEIPDVTKTTEQPKWEEPVKQTFISKRIAAVVSFLLCITLYLAFLTTVFTIKRDTYICYTTNNGDLYHAATCVYLNTSYETTIYEACRDYKRCTHCNPSIEQYKTTITERNYVAPLLVSVPLSGVVFLLLTYKKKQK